MSELLTSTEPTVSVAMITYNHEPYIREAIEGVLMQKVDFPIEFVIHDDASTDKTAVIVSEYAAQYPNIIVALYQQENQKSRGRRPLVDFVLPRCRGKYIALCEGDDYWTDPLKLQKQVGFLETHPEYGLVHADCDYLYADTGKIVRKATRSFRKPYYTNQDDLFDALIAGSYKLHTPTVLFRTSLLYKIQNELDYVWSRFMMGDTPMWLEMSRISQFHYMDEVFAVYRLSSGTVSRPKNEVQRLHFRLSAAEMALFFVKKYRSKIPVYLRKRYNKQLLLYKVAVPDYVEMYPLIQPSVFEAYLFNQLHNPITKFFLQLWHLKERVVNRFLWELGRFKAHLEHARE